MIPITGCCCKFWKLSFSGFTSEIGSGFVGSIFYIVPKDYPFVRVVLSVHSSELFDVMEIATGACS